MLVGTGKKKTLQPIHIKNIETGQGRRVDGHKSRTLLCPQIKRYQQQQGLLLMQRLWLRRSPHYTGASALI